MSGETWGGFVSSPTALRGAAAESGGSRVDTQVISTVTFSRTLLVKEGGEVEKWQKGHRGKCTFVG